MNTQKQITVDVQFTNKNSNKSIKLRALHNSKYLIEKASHSSEDNEALFKLAHEFIEKHGAAHIALKRGVIEDVFAKYLQNAKAEAPEVVEIEGVDLSLLSDEDKEILSQLPGYKNQLLESVKFADYKNMLIQGTLYNIARAEVAATSGQLANSFELTISLPAGEKEDILAAIAEVSKDDETHGFETLEVKKYKRRFEITKTDYKLAINFK